jgi:FKBP-type peptidyl-prolyl cis-trans isomerase 2
MAITTGDTVTFEYTARLDDGSVFDTSDEAVAEEAGLEEHKRREYEPLTVTVGEGQVIEGLDEGLVGLDVGEGTTVTIPPEKAYGEWDEDLVQEHDAEQFSQMIAGGDPEEGVHFETQDGQLGKIVHAGDDVVRLDFNHDLAGETLTFEIEIVDVE